MKIQITGTISGTSGYANHTRGLANALNKICDVKIKSYIPPGYEFDLTDSEIEMIKRDFKPEYNIIIDMPHNWKMHLEKDCKNIGFLVFEGHKIPKSWINECLNPEIYKIFVPSNHTKNAILNTITRKGIEKNIIIIPHGVDLNRFYPTDKPEKFTFIVNKGFRHTMDRGGTQFAIKAFTDEFNIDEAQMLVKINPAYGTNDIEKLLNSLKIRQNSPTVFINLDNIPFNEMNKVYNQGHVFVAPTMAEAYNIPCIEAMACGLPVITTNFGGQIDYVNENNGWIIGGEMFEVKHELLYEGINWLMPDLEQLKKTMREAYTEYKSKINNAIETAKNNTWDNSAIKLINSLK